jgi:probable Rubsico expression protein CbbX
MISRLAVTAGETGFPQAHRRFPVMPPPGQSPASGKGADTEPDQALSADVLSGQAADWRGRYVTRPLHSVAAIFIGLILIAFVAVVAVGIKGLLPEKAEEPFPASPTSRTQTARKPADQGRRSSRRAAAKSDRPAPALPADATVTFAAERQAADIDDVFTALDNDLVGLAPVKQKVHEIAALLLVDRARQRFGLEAPRPNLHMCFTGPPGTGKTTVALRMAEMLHKLGYLENDQVVHAMRDDLVGEYIGQTAPKTKRTLDRAKGGVLFIDEAYYLYRGGDSKDYGQEAIDILLQVMENDRDELVVILAGYKDRMDNFFTSNPGMSSRIAHHLDFAPYEIGELVAIGRLMLEQSRYYLSDEAEEAFRRYISGHMTRADFGNARSVRNELERARLQHAHRLATDLDHHWTRDDLMRLEPADILVNGVDVLARRQV